MRKMFEFGRMGVKRLCAWLFGIGTVAILASSCMVAVSVSMTYQVDRWINQGFDTFTTIQSNNVTLGFFCGLLCFLLGTLLWRLFCEMVYIILRFFQNNAKEDA